MAGGGQGSNPWAGTAPRGAGGGAFGNQQPFGGFPTSPYNANPWTNTGPRGAGGGPFGGGYRPGGPSVTMPGSIDPLFMTGAGDPLFMTGAGGLETGGTSPVPTQPNPTLSPPTMSTGFRVDENPGSMNKPFSGVGQQFTGQGGPGSFYGQYGQTPGGMSSGARDPLNRYFDNPAGNYGSPRGMAGVSGGPSSFGGPSVNGSSPGGGVAMPGQPAYSGEYFKPGQTLTADQLPAWNKWREAGMPSAPQAGGTPPTNIYGGPGSGAPYDPTTPGYQPGAGWQTMLRQYAMRDGQGNPNQYIQDRGLNPMWGGQRQQWEPEGFAGGLSQLLQRYRGF